MSAANPRLGPALLLSLALHGALLAPGLPWRPRAPAPAPAPLAAVLRPAQPPLVLPEPPSAPPAAPSRPRKAPQPAEGPAAPKAPRQPARTAAEQLARSLLYPPQAIARGLEGEALVLLFLDEAGNALAARIERSSGHAILDEAALRAAKTVRSLPAEAPREVLLPVRFRLQ